MSLWDIHVRIEFRLLKGQGHKNITFYNCIIFFPHHPKDSVTPSFNNAHLIDSVQTTLYQAQATSLWWMSMVYGADLICKQSLKIPLHWQNSDEACAIIIAQ
jgi:hypothetical protein